jgi:hypothetical protein
MDLSSWFSSKRNICPVAVACRVLVRCTHATCGSGVWPLSRLSRLSFELPVQAFKHAVVLRLDLTRFGRGPFLFASANCPADQGLGRNILVSVQTSSK